MATLVCIGAAETACNLVVQPYDEPDAGADGGEAAMDAAVDAQVTVQDAGAEDASVEDASVEDGGQSELDASSDDDAATPGDGEP